MSPTADSIHISHMMLNREGRLWSTTGAPSLNRTTLLINTLFPPLRLLEVLEPASLGHSESNHPNPFEEPQNLKIHRLNKEDGALNLIMDPSHENKILFHLWSRPYSGSYEPILLQTFQFKVPTHTFLNVYAELRDISIFDLQLKGEGNTWVKIMNVYMSFQSSENEKTHIGGIFPPSF